MTDLERLLEAYPAKPWNKCALSTNIATRTMFLTAPDEVWERYFTEDYDITEINEGTILFDHYTGKVILRRDLLPPVILEEIIQTNPFIIEMKEKEKAKREREKCVEEAIREKNYTYLEETSVDVWPPTKMSALGHAIFFGRDIPLDFFTDMPGFESYTDKLSSNPCIPIKFIMDTPQYKWDYNRVILRSDMTLDIWMNNRRKFTKFNPMHPFFTEKYLDGIMNSMDNMTAVQRRYYICQIAVNPSLGLDFFMRHRNHYDQEWFDTDTHFMYAIRTCRDIEMLEWDGVDMETYVINHHDQISVFKDFTIEFARVYPGIMWDMGYTSYDNVTAQDVLDHPDWEWDWDLLSHMTFGELEKHQAKCAKKIWYDVWLPYWNSPKFEGKGKGYDLILKKKACARKIWYDAWLPYWYNPDFSGQNKGFDKDYRQWLLHQK